MNRRRYRAVHLRDRGVFLAADGRETQDPGEAVRFASAVEALMFLFSLNAAANFTWEIC